MSQSEELWGAKSLSMGFVIDNRRLWPLCYDRHSAGGATTRLGRRS